MKQMKVFIYILVTAFILSSCSIQKRCQAPELNLPDEIIAGENDTLTIADMSWWELYSDSTLSKLIKKTLRNNRWNDAGKGLWQFHSNWFCSNGY